MATIPRVSLDEYLNTDYEPDCEYVEGALEDRNVGKRKHSETQALLCALLLAARDKHFHRVFPEQRVQISRSQVRIPDVCLVRKEDSDEVIKTPPALWIEILSPEDRWSRVQTKLADVLHFGVPTVWVIDPYSRQAWMATHETALFEITDGVLRCTNPSLEISLEAVLPQD